MQWSLENDLTIIEFIYTKKVMKIDQIFEK